MAVAEPREQSIIVTLVAPDRPGLVEAVSDVIARHDGNWEASRMAHLAGHFAGILSIRAPEDRAPGLATDLLALETRVTGLRLQLVLEDGDDARAFDDEPATWEIDLLGQDQPGIVRRLSAGLAALAVNVEELQTGCREAPHSGERLFSAHARIRPPARLSMDALRAALEPLSADMFVEIGFHDRSE